MNVYDLLSSADIARVAAIYVARRNYLDVSDESFPENSERGMKLFVSNLLALSPVTGSDKVMVPVCYLEDGEEYVCSNLYQKADVVAFKPAIGADRLEGRLAEVRTCDMNELPALMEDVELPDCYGYLFLPWEEILGGEVFVPEGASEEFMAGFVEDVLWEMSFNGMTKQEQEERRQELDEMLDRADAAMAEGRVKPADDALAELREKYGLVDERSQEEKEAEKRRMYEELIANLLATTRALIECKGWLRSSIF